MPKTKLLNFIRQVTPPFIFSSIKKSRYYGPLKKWVLGLLGTPSQPKWNTISEGILKGRQIFFDPKGSWQKEMINGKYDDFIFNYLKNLDLKDKTLYDIGAHIGFHSLSFAEIVGERGKVVSFEPNLFNLERFKIILQKNPDLEQRIRLCEVAISNNDDHETFLFSNNIENGTSSGGFIDSADTLFERGAYSEFKEVQVRTIRLDNLEEKLGITDKPDLLKIDVEGAEGLVLAGATETIKKYHPIMVIEVHSIFSMYQVINALRNFGYQTEILKKEEDGRCLLVANIKNQIV